MTMTTPATPCCFPSTTDDLCPLCAAALDDAMAARAEENAVAIVDAFDTFAPDDDAVLALFTAGGDAEAECIARGVRV